MSRDIKDLFPPIQPLAEELKSQIQQNVCSNGLLVIFSSTLRTIAEQNKLYAQGRNGDKGKIVTYAKGGYSFHNYGLALDIAFIRPDSTLDWSIALFNKSGLLGQKLGFNWGGSWPDDKEDSPHFQYDGGLTIEDVRSGKMPVVGKYDYKFAQKQAGKIFLQVEANGEAYYINPKTLKAEYMGKTPKEMLAYVQKTGVGISNKDLNRLK